MHSLPSSIATFLQTEPMLPVKYGIALKPWFSKPILKQGLALLQNNEVQFFTLQRHYAGLILDDDIQAKVMMAPGSGKLRFVFRDGECSSCLGRQQGGIRCKHVAALAMLCLQEQDNRLEPVAELFPNNPWAIIGMYLHDRSSISKVKLKIEVGKSCSFLRAEDSTGEAAHEKRPI